ncbi:glycoside hydrolase family 75 protein [Streptomyces sp. ISL-12]|uniref:glycoside hydrolase family 75 protein n=1 Tax=Streptomyces sp. ISL-12 TaxID=2819177 RepID=UPI001BEAB0FF|nr:glycoside hydrolase family 75 protein [Streptomyces sp. ISL-12]MBT2414813.1 glycoside hydrolase family 75 protein [Streptomyces sp. ISL-12]
MTRAQSLTLVAASAALLAPTTLPDASPPRPGAEVHARTAFEEVREKPGDDAVTAAGLLAKARDCAPVAPGRYRGDAGRPADIPVCGTPDAVFWKADLDVDCDGRPGARCNRATDPAFTASTAFTQSDGRPLDAERLPYIVVPGADAAWNHRDHGITGGSVAAVVYRDRVRYAVVGDVGPRGVVGEGSYALAEELGIRPDPRAGGVPSGVTYIVFKGSRVDTVEDRSAAERTGERLARRFLTAS